MADESTNAAYLLNADIDPGVAAQLKAILGEMEADASRVNNAIGRSWQEAQAYAKGYFSELENGLSLQEQVAAARARADENAFDAAQRKIDALEEELKLEQEFIDKVNEEQAAHQAAADAQQLALTNMQAAGYGVSGGLPGPAEDTGEGGTSIGSAFAIGHGLSVAGHALGSPGLREAGGFVYIEESLRRVGPLLEQMNAALLESGGLIPSLTESFAAAGVPMAGLAATLGPLAIVAGAVVISAVAINAVFQDAVKAIDSAAESMTAFYKAIETGTRESIQAQIGLLEQQHKDVQDKAKQFGDQLASAVQQSGEGLSGIAVGVLSGLTHIDPKVIEVMEPPTQELAKKFNEATDEAKKLAAQIEGLKQAMSDEQVAANTKAEQARKQADQDIQLSAQYAADDKLTAQGVKDKLAALQREGADQVAAAEKIKATNAALVVGSQAWQDNQKAIEAHEKTAQDDRNEIDHLTDVSMGLAETREAETNAINAEDAAMQRHITYLEQATRLRETGTEQQFASMRAGLEGRLSGDKVDLAYLQGKTDPTAAEKKKIEDLKADIVEVTNDLADLDKNIKPIVDVRAAIEGSAKALDDFSKKSSTLANDLAIQSATARERETNAERQYTEGSLQDTFERTKIATAESRKVLDIEQQTSDKITDIVTKFGQKQEDLALDLRRQEEDDVTKYYDGVVKAETDAQRTAEGDKVEHLQRLADLERQSNIDKQQALLDRNFLELTKIDLHKQDAIQKEDDSFNQREAKLQVHLKQQEEDLFRSLQQEERLQMLQEQRKVEDATRAAQREIEVANLAETRKIEAAQQSEDQQLADLTINETYKIQLLRQGLQDELTLMAETEQAKLTLLAATRDAIIAQAIASLAQTGNPSSPGGPPQGIGPVQGPSTFDSGGSFGAGQWLTKGSLSEEFDFGGSAYNLGGAALIYPLQSGTVTPGKGGGDIHYAPTIQVSGSVDQQTLAQLQRLLQTHGDSLIQQVGEMLSP